MQAEFGDEVQFLGVAGQATRSESEGFIDRFSIEGFPQVYDESGDFRDLLGGVSRSTFLFINDDGITTLTQYGQIDATSLRTFTQQLIDA